MFFEKTSKVLQLISRSDKEGKFKIMKLIKQRIKNILGELACSVSFKERTLPDFLIIGAQKSGTTALYSYLTQHPGIIPARCKEVHYFSNPYNYKKGRQWYASHFPAKEYKEELAAKLGYMPITGEATPDMHMPFIPRLVYDLLPSVKLIAILRNPVERAYSQYQHNCRHGKENLSFEEAIAQSSISLPPEIAYDQWAYHKNTTRSYIRRGLYVENLQLWFKYFGKESIYIMNSEEFFANPQSELNKLLEFLKMPYFEFKISEKPVHAGNYTEKMDEKMRKYLTDLYRPYNKRLFELIGRDFGWPC